jgi:alpha-galactosidase
MEHAFGPLGADGVIHLRAGGTSLVVDTAGAGLPRVLHWGSDLGELSDTALVALRLSSIPQVVSNSVDRVVPLSLLPEQSRGWLGTPGVQGHRDGHDFSPAFVVDRLALDSLDGTVAHRLTVSGADADAGLGLTVELELTVSGLVRTRATLTNTSETTGYTLDAVLLALPVPTRAQEILDFTGRRLHPGHPPP